jgi:hypothetical protein
MKLLLKKEHFNDAYLPAMDDENRVKVIYGGSGSGKSHFIAMMLILKIIKNKGVNVLITRKVGNTLRHSVFSLLKQVIYSWKLDDYFLIKETDMIIEFKLNKNQIVCKGLDDRERIKSITFPTGILTDIWMEEASEFEQEDFMQLNLRLRGKSNVKKQIIISFNPISAESWLKSYFFNSNYKCYILKTTYKDNKFIDDDYANELENLRENDPLYWDVYCNGNWGVIDQSNCVISLKNLIKAKTTNLNVQDEIGEIVISVDPARFGNDDTVIFSRKGYKVFEPIKMSSSSITDIAERVYNLYKSLRREFDGTKISINIDSTGVGGGLVDVLNKDDRLDRNTYVYGICFSESPTNKDKYYDITSEMLFTVADVLKNEIVDIPPVERLITELGNRLYDIDNRGRYRAENKKDYKKRIGRSPDYADAFMLLFRRVREIVFL